MSLKHGLLGLLAQKPMTGYELDKEFSASLGGFWQAKSSQIYRELDGMEKTGWLTSQRVLQEEKPNKRVYHISQTGREELATWINNPQADAVADLSIKSAFLMRIFFAEQGQMATLLRTYLDALEQAETITGGTHLTNLYNEIMHRAKVNWVAHVSGGFMRPTVRHTPKPCPVTMGHKLGGYDYEIFTDEIPAAGTFTGAGTNTQVSRQIPVGTNSTGGNGLLYRV
ncbi:MAG: PadR family transcriptional regulator [Defluviitaleaceae bacterium]|nr:PadR family transcriptional regulator [Defluviitaleaceae bacterium]